MTLRDCLFCKIISKDIPAEIIKEIADVLVFQDIKPKARIHYLVVPKNHIESIKSAGGENIAAGLVKIAKTIAQEKNIVGYKLLFNVGRDGGQEIDHLHLHFMAN